MGSGVGPLASITRSSGQNVGDRAGADVSLGSVFVSEGGGAVRRDPCKDRVLVLALRASRGAGVWLVAILSTHTCRVSIWTIEIKPIERLGPVS